MHRITFTLSILLCNVMVLQGQATTTVNTLADENGSGTDCSLREAITAANSDAPFGGCPGSTQTYRIDFSVNGTINLTEGQIDVVTGNLGNTRLLRIDGGENTVVATPLERIFRVEGDWLVLRNLNLTGGDVSGETGLDAVGGAIYHGSGTLQIVDSRIYSNLAASGGGVYSSGQLTFVYSEVTGNQSLFGGGGIYSSSTAGVYLDLQNSTVSGNVAGNGAGGGLNIQPDPNGTSTAYMSNSTVSGNSSSICGGLITSRQMVIDTSTISGNLLGGGLCNYGYGRWVQIMASTIADNSASFDGGGLSIVGTQGEPSPYISLYNTIVAGNASASVPDIYTSSLGFYQSNGFNLIGDPGAVTTFVDGANNDLVGIASPLLGPLADNGGPTETHALLTGSPAIDSGECVMTNFTEHDQRHFGRTTSGPRAVDGDNNGSIICDRGSFEFDATSLPVELVSFVASSVGSDITLQWKTASERNNAGFEVEELNVNGNFDSVDYIEGAGTTTETRSYELTLQGVSSGKHVFQLKQVDYDGSFSYSNEVEVVVDIPTGFSVSDVFPNPFSATASIHIVGSIEQDISVAVIDLLGRDVETIYEGRIGANERKNLVIKRSGLSAGHYLVRISGLREKVVRLFTVVK